MVFYPHGNDKAAEGQSSFFLKSKDEWGPLAYELRRYTTAGDECIVDRHFVTWGFKRKLGNLVCVEPTLCGTYHLRGRVGWSGSEDFGPALGDEEKETEIVATLLICPDGRYLEYPPLALFFLGKNDSSTIDERKMG